MSTKFATPSRRGGSVPVEPWPDDDFGSSPPNPTRPMWVVWVGAVIAVIAAISLIFALWANDDSTESASPLVLSAGDGGVAGSCLPFSVETLAGMPQAFAGTVTAISSNTITIAVDRWYTGGDANTVELTTIADAEALLGGPSYEVGSKYLITASDGAVNYCGYTGAATAELSESFASAFG